jgi:hypothetical protein
MLFTHNKQSVGRRYPSVTETNVLHPTSHSRDGPRLASELLPSQVGEVDCSDRGRSLQLRDYGRPIMVADDTEQCTLNRNSHVSKGSYFYSPFYMRRRPLRRQTCRLVVTTYNLPHSVVHISDLQSSFFDTTRSEGVPRVYRVTADAFQRFVVVG